MQVDAKHTALVLVDLMERIVGLPLGPRSGGKVVETAISLAKAFRRAGATVVVVRVERPNVAEQPPGSELVGEVAEADDILIVKRTIGGFQGTGLHEQLQARGIATLVFAGIATNMGVESTARAASDHGYDVVFVEDAMAALTTEEHHASVTYDFPRFGDVVAAADITLR
jgi:nicotinamidase-related amidase